MSKLVILIALYAAAVSTYLLVGANEREVATDAGAGSATASGAEIRRGVTRAVREAREEVQRHLRQLDAGLARLNGLRKEMSEELLSIQEGAESAARLNAGHLEAMDEKIARFEGLEKRIQSFEQSLAEARTELAGLAGLVARLERLEARPAAAAPAVQPTQAEPPGPKRPTLPEPPKEDPAVVAAEIEKALKDLASDKLNVVWPAIERVRKRKVLAAAPRLIEILGGFKDAFARQAAAAALGEMQSADAVPSLAEALTDKADLVAQQANKAIMQVAAFDAQISASARIQERRRARLRVLEWWKQHEDEVRARLKQPK